MERNRKKSVVRCSRSERGISVGQLIAGLQKLPQGAVLAMDETAFTLAEFHYQDGVVDVELSGRALKG